jgi:hypothetical protein
MYGLGWQMPQPGVQAEGEGVSTAETNIVGCSYVSSRVYSTYGHRSGRAKLHLEALVEHDNDVIHCRLADLRKNTHHKDVWVGLANASTWCPGRRGWGVHSGNEHCWMFVCKQQGVFNMLTLSSDPRNLSNNK